MRTNLPLDQSWFDTEPFPAALGVGALTRKNGDTRRYLKDRRVWTHQTDSHRQDPSPVIFGYEQMLCQAAAFHGDCEIAVSSPPSHALPSIQIALAHACPRVRKEDISSKLRNEVHAAL